MGKATIQGREMVLERLTCEELDVNIEMVRRGMAWRYVKYDKAKLYVVAEAEAKTAGRGLWADKEPIPPWEWRAKRKAK